ncbi:MAG TPA: hypothetical protein VHA52_11210 [Candidatus Babeliaceae bacterium]|nr:hypothetical protein [Candidatus Babeliaceae bacterium]
MIFYKHSAGGYSSGGIINPSNLLLIEWFLESINLWYDDYIDLLCSPRDESMSSNCCYLFKRGITSTIGYTYTSGDEEWEAELLSSELIRLIVKWRELVEKNTAYIVITQEGEKYSLIGGDKEAIKQFLLCELPLGERVA